MVREYNLKEEKAAEGNTDADFRESQFYKYGKEVIKDITALEETYGDKLRSNDEPLDIHSDDEIGKLSLSLWNNLGKFSEFTEAEYMKEGIESIVHSYFVFDDDAETVILDDEDNDYDDVLDKETYTKEEVVKVESVKDTILNVQKECSDEVTLPKKKRKKKRRPNKIFNKERKSLVPRKLPKDPILAQRIIDRCLPYFSKTGIDDVD